MCLAKNLKYLRLKHGYSQDYIAEMFGYKSYTTIQKWESGESEPSVEKLRTIAKLYGVSMNSLLNNNIEVDGAIDKPTYIPDHFESVKEAMEFILRVPVVANNCGYDLDTMSEEEIIEMAEDLSEMLQIMAKKHRKK